MTYEKFLEQRSQLSGEFGFDPVWMPDFFFDFQKYLVEWALKKGRSAIFADCGMGKTPMQLVWAENVVRKTNGRVLILTPLAVSSQTVKEGEKFGIEVTKTSDGSVKDSGIYVTNYERLHHFDSGCFDAVVCDESSILKNCNGTTKTIVTRFGAKMKYRLLCTATAAPNDYIELGTSSECLGDLGYMDMLQTFFKSTDNSVSPLTNIHTIDRVLPYIDTRDEKDERHVHPLQLDAIERCVTLWSNPGDRVFTPFMGVGSEVYGAVKNKRLGIGVELKESYYRQAVLNLESLQHEVGAELELSL